MSEIVQNLIIPVMNVIGGLGLAIVALQAWFDNRKVLHAWIYVGWTVLGAYWAACYLVLLSVHLSPIGIGAFGTFYVRPAVTITLAFAFVTLLLLNPRSALVLARLKNIWERISVFFYLRRNMRR